MGRPMRRRRICFEPVYDSFAPCNAGGAGQVLLAVDEFEAVRLIDHEKKTHEQCAKQMGVSRTTVTEMYERARAKIADCLVNGKTLCISGGNYALCDGSAWRCCGKKCKKRIHATEAGVIDGQEEETHASEAGGVLDEKKEAYATKAGAMGGKETEKGNETRGHITKNGVVGRKETGMKKIAVTYENGNVFPHFGHTEQFKVYEVEDGKVAGSQIVGTQGSGHGALAGMLLDLNVDTLVCGGIGAGAQIALAEAGIQLYGGVSGSADEAVDALLAGKLNYNPDVHCDHHGQGHHCGEESHCGGGHACGEDKHGCAGNGGQC